MANSRIAASALIQRRWRSARRQSALQRPVRRIGCIFLIDDRQGLISPGVEDSLTVDLTKMPGQTFHRKALK